MPTLLRRAFTLLDEHLEQVFGRGRSIDVSDQSERAWRGRWGRLHTLPIIKDICVLIQNQKITSLFNTYTEAWASTGQDTFYQVYLGLLIHSWGIESMSVLSVDSRGIPHRLCYSRSIIMELSLVSGDNNIGEWEYFGISSELSWVIKN
jgi:hypothetical protein